MFSFVQAKSSGRSIPAEAYDRGFFLGPFLEGYDEYQEGRLSLVKRTQLHMLQLRPGTSLLEVGFGRGELLLHCARAGARVTGIDYSPQAFAIARETLRDHPAADLRLADCRQLPFPDDSFERVVSGDVIEHLSFSDAVRMLRESWRVLRPGGHMLIHTTPNVVFTQFIYPVARPLLWFFDREMVEAVDRHLEEMCRLHVDEYSLWSLGRVARCAGLPQAKTWINADLLRSGQHRHTRTLARNRFFRALNSLGRWAPVRLLLGNDLYLQCRK
jgi:ubiquinone/menaquinone biosynthesis C-methylase UbiE